MLMSRHIVCTLHWLFRCKLQYCSIDEIVWPWKSWNKELVTVTVVCHASIASVGCHMLDRLYINIALFFIDLLIEPPDLLDLEPSSVVDSALSTN
jgi:hypothetical protein